MNLQKISLYKYRNLIDQTIIPGRKFNIIYGNNAQGKTNFLESIYLTGNIKSFRSTKNIELISLNANNSVINAEFLKNNVKRKINIEIYEKIKNIQIDSKKINKTSDILGKFNIVIFTPEEMSIVKGYPEVRRSFLDKAIVNISSDFLESLINYKKILGQRNRIIKECRNKKELDIWSELLIEEGTNIRKKRIEYLNDIKPIFCEIYQNISQNKEIPEINYFNDYKTKDDLINIFINDLQHNKEKEYQLGITLSGPQRDDIIFKINDNNARQFSSQGQQKTFIISFKIAQIIDIVKRSGESPVLLLDDMRGELDSLRQEYLYKFLSKLQGQVFITSTDKDNDILDKIEYVDVFKMTSGHLVQEY